jgi:uncharacterized protein (AIM24 family)
MGGVRGFLSETGLFFVKVSNPRYVFLSSFGAIQERQIDGRFRVDSGHIVGFTNGLDWKIGTFGGVKSTLLGGGASHGIQWSRNGFHPEPE